jgi:hypothetical protein
LLHLVFFKNKFAWLVNTGHLVFAVVELVLILLAIPLFLSLLLATMIGYSMALFSNFDYPSSTLASWAWLSYLFLIVYLSLLNLFALCHSGKLSDESNVGIQLNDVVGNNESKELTYLLGEGDPSERDQLITILS